MGGSGLTKYHYSPLPFYFAMGCEIGECGAAPGTDLVNPARGTRRSVPAHNMVDSHLRCGSLRAEGDARTAA